MNHAGLGRRPRTPPRSASRAPDFGTFRPVLLAVQPGDVGSDNGGTGPSPSASTARRGPRLLRSVGPDGDGAIPQACVPSSFTFRPSVFGARASASDHRHPIRCEEAPKSACAGRRQSIPAFPDLRQPLSSCPDVVPLQPYTRAAMLRARRVLPRTSLNYRSASSFVIAGLSNAFDSMPPRVAQQMRAPRRATTHTCRSGSTWLLEHELLLREGPAPSPPL